MLFGLGAARLNADLERELVRARLCIVSMHWQVEECRSEPLRTMSVPGPSGRAGR